MASGRIRSRPAVLESYEDVALRTHNRLDGDPLAAGKHQRIECDFGIVQRCEVPSEHGGQTLPRPDRFQAGHLSKDFGSGRNDFAIQGVHRIQNFAVDRFIQLGANLFRQDDFQGKAFVQSQGQNGNAPGIRGLGKRGSG